MRNYLEVPLEPFCEFDPFGGEPPPDGFAGHLLVATPTVDDPNFWRRVILVLDHSVHGALGVVIDHPGGVAVEQVLPRWHGVATAPAEVFTGGPVSRNSLIGLVRLAARPDPGGDRPETPDGWHPVVDDDRPVGTVDLAGDPEPWSAALVGARVFSGYAGWETGQLEDEIDEGSWYVIRAEARDVVSADPEGLWRRVLRRQGGALALVSGFPADPAHN